MIKQSTSDEGILRAARKAKGLTMEEMSTLLGISYTATCSRERTARLEGIRVETLRDSLDALGYDMEIIAVPRDEQEAVSSEG